MATNAALKKALLKELEVTPQALSQRAQKRKKELPMTTEQAVYTIAHENGIDLSKYLDPETTREVRDLMTQLRAGQSTDRGRRSGQSTRSRPAGKSSVVNVTIKGIGPESLKIPP